MVNGYSSRSGASVIMSVAVSSQRQQSTVWRHRSGISAGLQEVLG
jgi:hypothetical protein